MPADAPPHRSTEALNPSKSSESPSKPAAASGPIPGFDGPRSFGRLTLLKAIAQGGMGEVYLAAAGGIEGAERPCVVKLIRTEHREDSSFLARFLDEARIQAQMQHPGVAQVLEAAIDPDGQPYVVVEHIAGRDLAEVRQRALRLKLQLSWADAVATAVSIADALAHVHEQTDAEGRPLLVAHRDLSPQNIMVSYGGDIKLIDFGTARGENRRCQTVNGIVFAKPGYVAPEVAANSPGGAPADLYAMGIVLWELIAGRRFLQGNAQEHLAAVAKGERTPPALSLWLSIPKEIDAIIAKLTTPNLDERFPSAREAFTRLQRVLEQAPSLANGDRSVRSRIAHLMLRLYPAEPARSRAEFAQLLGRAQSSGTAGLQWPKSPHPAEVAEREKLLPGTRYHVEREIAHGPMSAVYEAQHVDLGRKVALKVLARKRCKNKEGEAEFREEARIVARLHHENLVQIHDFGVTSDGRPYYAMEYLDGETAAQLLQREGRLLWPEVLDIGIQACHALEAAHRGGIVHRDIKPANLLLTHRGTLKVLDFGITGSQKTSESGPQGPLVLMGTPEYMAPEQVASHNVDGRADVFALGTVLYELLTGQLPFQAESTMELLDSKMRTHAQSPSRAVRGLNLPRYLNKVVCTALASRPEDRYDNAQSLRLDLEWILQKGRKDAKPGRRIAATVSALGIAAACGVFVLDTLPEQGFKTVAIQSLSEVAEPAPRPVLAQAPQKVQSRTPRKVRSTAEIEIEPIEMLIGPATVPAARPELPVVTPQPPLPAATPLPGPKPPSANQIEDRRKQEARDELRQEVARAETLIEDQQRLRALNAYRALARKYPNEPAVLSGLSRAAEGLERCGEALKAAEKWVSLDDSPRAIFRLAEAQKNVAGKRKAKLILEDWLKNNSDDEQAPKALALLKRFR